MSLTGMTRAQLMELYYEMHDAQQARLERALCEDGAERAAYLGLADTPSASRVEEAVTFSKFLRSIGGAQPPTAEELAKWDAAHTRYCAEQDAQEGVA